MVDPRLVERKLSSLLACMDRVRQKYPASRDSFLADQDVREIVAFNLFLAFQEALDLAAHFIADAGWQVPVTAREHFEVLASHGFLDPALAVQLAACAGARNLSAHAYGSIDFERLYTETPAGLSALERFAIACEEATSPS
jgi:uncharacterized protein YutE (UPF0331/DUF86 family)